MPQKIATMNGYYMGNSMHRFPFQCVMRTLIGALSCLIFILTLTVTTGGAFPIDGYKETGIRRLLRLERMASRGEIKKLVPPGGRRPADSIMLRLVGSGIERLPPVDQELQNRIDLLFPDRHESYGLALLSVGTDGSLRFAMRQGDVLYSPGSVGKLAIAAGLFTELARLFPGSVEKRRELLKNRMIGAGAWIISDHHDVPLYDPASEEFTSRPIQEGDVFSLYEWIDHMLSASANAAGSTVWKELILMRHFGNAYPPGPDEEKQFFAVTPKETLRDLAMAVVNAPLRRIGVTQDDWQLGSFFTATGKKLVPPGGKSFANAKGFITFLLALEQGRIVDQWSSLEIKKMMYMTARRIRYASSPALNADAVYFKSGSLYRCGPEPGFTCGKYKGNVENYMNSVAIVEKADGRFYLAVLVSNVLKKNSAVEHQTLATEIDRILATMP